MTLMFKNLLHQQYLPSKEDIENKDIKKLANRLKGKDDKETLTNVLEWQERNVQPWIDRWRMFPLLYILLFLAVYFLPIVYPIKLIITLILIIFAIFNLTLILSYFIPILSYIIVLSTWAFSVNPNMEKIFPLNQLVVLSIIFGGLLFLLVYLIIKYRSIKSFYPDFKLEDTFKLSLSIDKILKYRLAVCRDYAKLAATLLLDLYPKNKIYFFVIPYHVATGIDINGKIYILDKKLPIYTPNKWLEYWKYRMKKKKIKIKSYKITTKEDTIELNSVDLTKSFQEISGKTKIEKLTNEASKTLDISQDSSKEGADFEFPLKDYAICYDEDEMIRFSLVRVIKNKLIDEFSGNSDKISKIDVVEEKNDLILKVYTR